MYVYYVHVHFGHVHMHAICCVLYCHVCKLIYMLGGFHITAYMDGYTCYMLKLLHMHMISVAASKRYVCCMVMLHCHHDERFVVFHVFWGILEELISVPLRSS